MNHLLDNAIDLSGFDAKYCNDATGAAAYPPAMLLKVVLFAYSQGIVSSRAIERACREHITFIALSGDSQTHFTTFAGYASFSSMKSEFHCGASRLCAKNRQSTIQQAECEIVSTVEDENGGNASAWMRIGFNTSS